MGRALVLLVLIVALGLGAAAPALAEDTAIVHGVLTDNAVVKKAVTNATVTIAGLEAAVSGTTYTVTGVPPGEQTMVVSAPRHMAFTQAVLLVAGDNAVDVSLGLTARETYRRYFNSYNHFRYRVAYRMVHPDVRAHYPFAKYRDYMWFWTHPPFLSSRILQIRTLATWRPDYLRKTYSDVKAIKSERTYRCPGQSTIFKDRGTGHWVEVADRWYDIFDWH